MRFPLRLEKALEKEGLDIGIYRLRIPKYIRLNPRRDDLANLPLSELEAKLGMRLRTYSWTKHFRISRRHKLPRNPFFLDGGFYRQDLASAAPVYALDPQNGESIVDVCAAPGGKAMLIADLIPQGTVLAVDNDQERFRKLQENRTKYSPPNLTLLLSDATNDDYARGRKFDRILVDAPCPGEGNLSSMRGGGRKRWKDPHKFCTHFGETAYALVQTAYQNLKEGGVMVYSTCTFQTEFNEALVGNLLRTSGGKLEEVIIPSFQLRTPHHPWMYRIYPSDNLTKGLFFAKIRKVPPRGFS